jgi:hypothetical protein
MSVSRPPAAASVAGNDAPLIGERAALRGRSVTEGGDDSAVRSALLVEAPALRMPAADDATRTRTVVGTPARLRRRCEGRAIPSRSSLANRIDRREP